LATDAGLANAKDAKSHMFIKIARPKRNKRYAADLGQERNGTALVFQAYL
jgi:hypothetical protein